MMLSPLAVFTLTLTFVCATMAGTEGNAPGWVSLTRPPRVRIDLNAYTQPFDLTAITAPDGSITAKFVSFGATLTELWVKDKNGEPRDVVLGYDDNVRLFSLAPEDIYQITVGKTLN